MNVWLYFQGMLGAKGTPPRVRARGDARSFAAYGGASNLTKGLVPRADNTEEEREIDPSFFRRQNANEQPYERKRGIIAHE